MIDLTGYHPPAGFPAMLLPECPGKPNHRTLLSAAAPANQKHARHITTDAEHGKRICYSCERKLDFADFPKNRTKAQGRGHQCKECRNTEKREKEAAEAATRAPVVRVAAPKAKQPREPKPKQPRQPKTPRRDHNPASIAHGVVKAAEAEPRRGLKERLAERRMAAA